MLFRSGRSAERAFVEAPGDSANRLNGRPVKLRYVWPDARELVRASGHSSEGS